jgi:hypothetical protein
MNRLAVGSRRPFDAMRPPPRSPSSLGVRWSSQQGRKSQSMQAPGRALRCHRANFRPRCCKPCREWEPMLIRTGMAEAATKATLARHPAAAVRTAGAASAANGSGPCLERPLDHRGACRRAHPRAARCSQPQRARRARPVLQAGIARHGHVHARPSCHRGDPARPRLRHGLLLWMTATAAVAASLQSQARRQGVRAGRRHGRMAGHRCRPRRPRTRRLRVPQSATVNEQQSCYLPANRP